MKKKHVSFPVVKMIVVALVLSVVLPARCIDAAEVKFKGFVQTWFSITQTEDDGSAYGFALRRARLKPYGSFGKNVTWAIQVGWDKQKPVFYDAWLDFKLSPGFKIKVGQFAAPGSISGALTFSSRMDFLERARVTQQWNSRAGMFGYRALGVQLHGKLLNNKLYYAVMLANPKTGELFTPSIKKAENPHEYSGPQVWARLELEPVGGLKLGAFYGGGEQRDKDTKTTSYGAHCFFIKNNLNIKFEYIAGTVEVDSVKADYSGLYALLGYKFGKLEPIVRYDTYKPGDAQEEIFHNITFGLNYLVSKQVKLQFNYVLRKEKVTDISNNIIYAMFQYVYPGK